MTNNKYESAKQYIENCKRNGPQSENKPRKEALYPMHGCQIYTDDNDATAHEGVIQQTANRKVEQQKQLMRDGFNPVSPKIPQAEEQKNCPYCHPYQERIIEGENGFYCVTKDAELIAFNHADEVEAVKAKINYCPICGRKLESQS